MTRARTRIRPVVTVREPWACRCKPRSYVLATFRNECLVSVERMHNRDYPNGAPNDCHLAPEPLDIKEWRDGR